MYTDGGSDETMSETGKSAFLLIHGAWHGAWCYERVIPWLARAGHMAAAIDMPGHGLNAKFPRSFLKRPVNLEEFSTEISPLAHLTREDFVERVTGALDRLIEGGSGPVVLVGHSAGGMAITAAGEAAPEKIKKMVYLAAFMPESGVASGRYIRTPENEGDLLGPLFLGDPAKTGATRIDPRSEDVRYRAQFKQALYNDVDDADFEAARNLLTSDYPAKPLGTPIVTTAGRWGSVPRAYVKCLQDNALRPRLQQHFIDLADAAMPGKKTEVVSLNRSHSPFLSAPRELAEVLIHLAR